MEISVILPVYNGSKTIIRTLDSLVAQNFNDFEILICDDFSLDDSYVKINNFIQESKFKRIRLIRNIKNLGLAFTLNRLIYEAKGEFLAIASRMMFILRIG